MSKHVEETTAHEFRINTPAFLKEITDNAIGANGGGVLFIPMNVLRIKLLKVAKRASELNDPELNKIMAEMALYAVTDPYDKENYDREICDALLKTGKMPTK